MLGRASNCIFLFFSTQVPSFTSFGWFASLPWFRFGRLAAKRFTSRVILLTLALSGLAPSPNSLRHHGDRLCFCFLHNAMGM